MATAIRSFLQRLFLWRELRQWSASAKAAETLDIPSLRVLRSRAKSLRQPLDRLIRKADERLALPARGSNIFPVPHGTDWSWRPALWRAPLPVPGLASVASRSRLGGEVTVHHDCIRSELSLRQRRNTREEDLAPYGLSMDVFAFDGTFLSLVVDLPAEVLTDLRKNHLIRLSTSIEVEKPIEIFARLNITHGPNTEQIVRDLPLNRAETMVEFDLAYSGLNEKRLEKAWLDLIFEDPQMNQIILHDVTFARCPRAEF
ncbi:DUF6478 family protein [Pseudooceanicola sp.]|uniref:DUF6478 family protein n=1 Tax=Pseudooceanicola sp. TaxID=1914328 RepID=UPI0035C6FC96